MRAAVRAVRALALASIAAALPTAGWAQPAARGGATTDVLSRVVRVNIDRLPVADAIDALARAAGARVSYSRETLHATRRVTLTYRAITFGTALTEVVAPDGLEITVTPTGLVVIAPRRNAGSRPLHGHVRDALTQGAIRGAIVSIAGSDSAVTDAAGEFRVRRGPAESRTVAVRRIGYVPRTVSIPAQDAPLVIQLDAAPVPVDRIVVMGSETETVQRALPSAVTVITGEELERSGFSTMEDVLRAFVPGLTLWDDGPGAPVSRLGSIRGASSFSVNFLKTYVNGVEVAAPYLPLLIDPGTIERVEIIRGPQGASLYGSNASSGVLQVITRAAPAGGMRGTASLEGGRMTSRFASGPVAVRGYAARGAAGAARGGIAGSFRRGTTGDFAPGSSVTSTAAGAAAYLAAGTFSVELSGQSGEKNGGLAINPIVREFAPALRHAPGDSTQRTTHNTLGATLRYSPAWWASFRVVGGRDRTTLRTAADPFPFISAADSFIVASRGSANRTTGRASVELRAPVLGVLASHLVLGADRSRIATTRLPISTAQAQPLATTLDETQTGLFAQTTLVIADAVHLTGGVREERSTAFGRDYGPARLPLVGAALVQNVGRVTLKVRGASGKGIRPPPVGAAEHATISNELVQIANPDLAPESQRGQEWGVDVFVSRYGRLQVTRYQQRAEGLVQQVLFDGKTRPRTVQQQNVGTIANDGWELETGLNGGPIAASATYARTDSRVTRIAPRYTGVLRAGDRMLEVPQWTASVVATISLRRAAVSAGLRSVGDWVNYDWLGLYSAAFRRDQPKPTPREYLITYRGFSTIHATIAVPVVAGAELYLRGDNLGNVQRGARDNLRVNTGRTIVFGMRAGN